MRYILTLIFILACSIAQAASVTCNENGAVVRLTDGTIYYLGKSCDAASADGRTGTWWLSASAYVVSIDGNARRLPVEPDCPALPACWSN
ncbi:MAG: hypothetical protein AAFQ58_02275 [Pseudomonadota bacterium]